MLEPGPDRLLHRPSVAARRTHNTPLIGVLAAVLAAVPGCDRSGDGSLTTAAGEGAATVDSTGPTAAGDGLPAGASGNAGPSNRGDAMAATSAGDVAPDAAAAGAALAADARGADAHAQMPDQPLTQEQLRVIWANRIARFADGISSEDWREAVALADANGDGIVSLPEASAAMNEGAMWFAMLNLEQFDNDGDGKISDAERDTAALVARGFLISELEVQFERMQVARFDADGDAVLSDAERAELQRQGPAWRVAHRLAVGLLRGTGPGDDEEGYAQRWGLASPLGQADPTNGAAPGATTEAPLAWMRAAAFRGRYDSDGDATVGERDMAVFLERYSSGHPHADVNLDGIVDAADLAEFSELMNRAGADPAGADPAGADPAGATPAGDQ